MRSLSFCSGVSGPHSVAAMIASISLTSTSTTVGFSFRFLATSKRFHKGRTRSCLFPQEFCHD